MSFRLSGGPVRSFIHFFSPFQFSFPSNFLSLFLIYSPFVSYGLGDQFLAVLRDCLIRAIACTALLVNGKEIFEGCQGRGLCIEDPKIRFLIMAIIRVRSLNGEEKRERERTECERE